MTFSKITRYQCDSCSKIYDKEPRKCECERYYKPGDYRGYFKILRREIGRRFRVLCLFCGKETSILQANIIGGTQSCGCKPRHIRIDHFEGEDGFFSYTCRKCGDKGTSELPATKYCCTGKPEE